MCYVLLKYLTKTIFYRASQIQLHRYYFQVHGIVNDTVEFVKGVLTTEINSATDNPVSLLYIVKLNTV